MSFYNAIYKIFRHPVRWLWRIKAEGVENIPESGAILVCNHTALTDVLVLEAACTRQIKFMAKAELFKIPLLAQLIRALGAYPVNRGGSDVKSLKLTISLVESGDLVGIFPQGTRCPKTDPRETEVKSGVGMLAYHAKATIVPAFIDNKRGKTGIFRRNRVIFGKAIPFEDLPFEKGGKAEYPNASKYIFDSLCELKYGSRDTWEKNDG